MRGILKIKLVKQGFSTKESSDKRLRLRLSALIAEFTGAYGPAFAFPFGRPCCPAFIAKLALGVGPACAFPNIAHGLGFSTLIAEFA